jgi:hypothetical protein
MKLDHDAPDGMCVMAGCQFQAEKKVSWQTSQGQVVAPVCQDHMRQCWEKTVPGATSRDTFTILPL